MMMTALVNISSEQAHATKHMLIKCKIILDYAAMYPSTFIRFYTSDIILHIDSDAAYLVKPKACSRVAGFFYLDNIKPRQLSRLNGVILIE